MPLMDFICMQSFQQGAFDAVCILVPSVRQNRRVQESRNILCSIIKSPAHVYRLFNSLLTPCAYSYNLNFFYHCNFHRFRFTSWCREIYAKHHSSYRVRLFALTNRGFKLLIWSVLQNSTTREANF